MEKEICRLAKMINWINSKCYSGVNENALMIELIKVGLRAEQQRPINVYHEGH